VDLCSPTVFVVDDEAVARDSVAALVSSMNLGCRSFSSAEQFLDNYDPFHPGCVVIDMHLDGMNGLQLQERLAGQECSIPVVFMGAYLNVPIAVRAMQNGAITVLEKPLVANQLADAIQKAVDISREELETRNRRTNLRNRYNSLNKREQEVVALIINGMPNKTIARDLDISQRTVARIRSDVFKKMGADSAVDLAQMAIELWGTRHDDEPLVDG
jgi:two-component system, LuxR family, response regulator FixJ